MVASMAASHDLPELPFSKSQIVKLGERLVEVSSPSLDDQQMLNELLSAHAVALAVAVARVRDEVGVAPSARVKNTGTIIEKLRRHGGSWLKSIHDLAGMRIVSSADWAAQDAVVSELVEAFGDGARPPQVIDRREHPSHGYAAVHVIVFVGPFPVEVQVRTYRQHLWSELFEKLADRVGRVGVDI